MDCVPEFRPRDFPPVPCRPTRCTPAGHAGRCVVQSTHGQIIAAAIEVHRTLGPGLLESAYAQCLRRELATHGVRFEAERTIPIVYKGTPLDAKYRVDLVVEDLVVVEVKAVDTLAPVHRAQALTYLAMTGCVVGLVINFNVAKLVDGVMRVLAKGAYGERSPTTGPR